MLMVRLNKSHHKPLRGLLHQHRTVYFTVGVCVLGKVCEDFLHLELDSGELLALKTARMPDEEYKFYFILQEEGGTWTVLRML